MWFAHDGVFSMSIFFVVVQLVRAALPTQRASQGFFRATVSTHSPTFSVTKNSSVVPNSVGRHDGVDSLWRRPYCSLGRQVTTRFAPERIEIWIDPETNVRYIRSHNSSRTALAARCHGPFQAGDCLMGHPMNGAPPDCGALHCPCSLDTSLPVPSLREGKLRTAQSTLVKEVGRLCAEKKGKFSVLLLGLNHAVLAAYLEKRCPRRLHIDTVESNQHIVDAASAFLGSKRDKYNNIECADSWQYLMKLNATKKKYDLILTDCYGSDGRIPATCRAPSFMARLRTALKPGGLSFQDVGAEATKSMLMGYSAAFGKGNVALLGPDEVPVQFPGSPSNLNGQVIRAVASRLVVHEAGTPSAQSNKSLAASIPKPDNLTQSNKSVPRLTAQSKASAQFNSSAAMMPKASTSAQTNYSTVAKSNNGK